MTEEVFLKNLLEKRLKWVEASRENDFEEGIQRLLTDLYPDTAHFIFELLQNAEDAQSTHVLFDLKKDVLTVTHNGKRLFNNKDVESITSIAVSTKKDDITQIGKFGIGFKAVFAYTKSPCIYSGEFAFKIRDLVCPQPIENILSDKANTIFEFPFDHPKKRSSIAFEETADGLMRLGDNVLLFLNNIETIEWDIEGKGKGFLTRLCHSDNHFEIDHKDIEGTRSNSHYMLFAKQIDPNSKIKNVAIAFKLDFLESSGAKKVTLFEDGVSIAKQMKVIQIDGQLSVFFPAEKETTKLQFHIHGPFASTIARDSIPYNSDNKKLMNEVGTLLAESLYSIKELGLLTVDLLAALPNDIDCLSDFYKPLQIAVVKEMKANPLVPTHLRSHASAAQLYQGPSAIREVISDEDLKFLIHWNGNIQWAVGVMQNSRPERFMRSLGITEWSWENLIDVMWANFRLHNSGNEQWIHSKSDDWLQRFYILLKKASDEQGSWKLEDCRIVRLQSGEYGRGNEAFFPAEDEKKSKKNNELFPKVKLDLLKGSRKAKVREFLESIGVKDVGKEEELKSILNTYYPSYDTVEAISHNKHITHMKKFVLHWNTQKSANLFSGFRIFFDHTGQILRPPAELYLDLPYNETGLEAYFDAARKLEIRKHKLWDGYKNQSIKHFEEFTKCLGIMDGLEIREHKATATQSHIFSGRSGKINRDYYINGLGWYNKGSSSYFGMFSLSADSICLSRLIWKLMSNTTTDALRAVYKTSHTEKNAPSLIVNQLREAKWIPDKDGKFRRHAEMAQATLHKDFPYDDRNGWLTTIGFGDAEKKKTEEYKTLKELCTKRGLSEDVAELLSEMAGLPREEQKERIKNFRKQLQEAKLKSSFPEKESPNPERRSKKVAENLPDAPEKSYEIRERSVRVSNGEAKIAAKEYLQDCYTNPDGEMVCQICEDVMPFKLDDGSFYFETVELLRDFPKECAEKYLALCPVCSAKFQYALGTKPEALSSAILNTDSLTSPLLLARENKTIRFVKVHLEDIRTLLQNVER